MSAALSKALRIHNPNWLAENLGTESYARKIDGVLYAVIVSPSQRLLAVYVVTPRQMRVRRVFSWPCGVVDPLHVCGDPALDKIAPPFATTVSSVFEHISEACQRTYALCEEILALGAANSRACEVARATLCAADAALVESARVLIGCDRPQSLNPARATQDAGRASV